MQLHIFYWVKNMKKIINRLFKVDKKTFLFLAILSIIGITTGALFMTILSSSDKDTINKSLVEYINNIGSIKFDFNSFLNNFIINIIYALIIWILGISIIGLPIVIIVIFFKSFLLSFSISSFVINFKLKGLAYGFTYLFPHAIINFLIYMFLGVYSIKLSLNFISAIINKKNINMQSIMVKYIKILIISVIIILITTLFETFVMPLCLNKIINML